MGKKPDWNALFQQLIAANQAATAPSPYETALAADWNNTRNWLNQRDYRNMPAGVNVDLLPIADYQKMRQMTRGTNNGTAAAGVMNPTILNQQRELDDNQFAQDWGGAYENALGGLLNRQDSLSGALQSAHANRMGMGMQGAMGALQAYGSRPRSIWSSLLPSILQGAGSVAGAFI